MGLRRKQAKVLTPRQHEVLYLVAEGLTNEEIAEKLIIEPHTAERHVHDILSRLSVPRRAQAVILAIRQGLIDLTKIQVYPHDTDEDES